MKDEPKFIRVPTALRIYGVNLSCTAKWVYTTLKSHENNKTLLIKPSVKTLARECGVSERAVINAINELRAFGWIERTRRFSTSSTYKLLQPDCVSPTKAAIKEFRRAARSSKKAAADTKPKDAVTGEWVRQTYDSIG